VYFEQTYGIPPEQVIGTAGGTKLSYDNDGKPFLTKEPKVLLNAKGRLDFGERREWFVPHYVDVGLTMPI
jgi:hypothetical protein